MDRSGNLIIADSGNNAVRRLDAITGMISTLAGDGGDCANDTDGLGDGCLAFNAILNNPTGLALDDAGNLFVSDTGYSIIRRVDAVTGIITRFAGGTGGCAAQTDQLGDGCPATSANIYSPVGLAFDGAGNLFIANPGTLMIRRVDAATGVITRFAGLGYGCAAQTDSVGDGCVATSARLVDPSWVAFDSAGNLLIADSGYPPDGRVRRVDASTGIITAVAGGGSGCAAQTDSVGDGCPALSAPIITPKGVVVDSLGNILVADSGNWVAGWADWPAPPGHDLIRRVDGSTGIITALVGNGDYGYSGDGGPATDASFYQPFGLATDGAGNLFIADQGNNRVRRVSAGTGIITTVAGGNGNPSYNGDGGLASNANLSVPYAVATDNGGNVFIADSGNNRIRRVDAVTGIITTVAGNGIGSYTGDGGPATGASLVFPYGVALDHEGDLFIANTNRVRRVDAVTGIITTAAGGGSGCAAETDNLGDGCPATSASLTWAVGVAVDNGGNLFIADSYNCVIRRVDAVTQVITTVAGTSGIGYGGDGGPAVDAAIYSPVAVAVDGAGNLFIADEGNNRVRRVSAATGIITTVAGNGIPWFLGDGDLATNASIDFPSGVAIDHAGNLFISDTFNNRIRRVPLGGGMTTLSASANPITAGQPVTLTATVTGISPTGTMTFTKNGEPLATVPVANGQATYTQAYPSANTKSIVAEYSGDNINQPSTSSPLNLVVNPATSTTTLVSSANPATAGQSVTLTATVTGDSPTGTMTFVKNGVALATVPLTNGQACYTQVYTNANTKTIVAEYSGDANNQPSTSAVLNLVVNPATSTTTLVSSANPATVGQPVTLTATVTSSSGLTPPDGGLVTFTKNGTVIATIPLASGQASYTDTFEVANTKSLVASYAGDVTNLGSTSNMLSLVVNPPPAD